VDVASGVEAAGGEKDHDAVREFVANAKADHAVVES
jgi:phosphoribosylanthranilate isomerase